MRLQSSARKEKEKRRKERREEEKKQEEMAGERGKKFPQRVGNSYSYPVVERTPVFRDLKGIQSSEHRVKLGMKTG